MIITNKCRVSNGAPEVTDKNDVKDQVKEMRKWFKAFQTQVILLII